MKALHSFLLVGTLALASASAAAQQRVPSEAATAEQRLAEDLGTEFQRAVGAPAPTLDVRNASVLMQAGAGNSATIDQQNLYTAGNQAYVVQAGALNVLGLTQTGGDNSAYLSQQGVGNRADLSQDGQRNSSTLLQRGANNRVNGVVDGNEIELNIQQDGGNNRVQSEVRQNGRTYNITQLGYGNTLTQQETTTQSPQGYSVEMRGVGINVTIQQGNVYR